MSFVGVLLLWSAMHHPEFAGTACARQPTGYGHTWGTSFGSVFNDEGRALAVTHDGSVVWTGTTLDWQVSDEKVPMTLVRRYGPGGEEVWSVAFVVEEPGTNAVASRALALADTSVEGPAAGIAYVAGRFVGRVDFGGMVREVSRDSGFVAKVRQGAGVCAGAAACTAWVSVFEALGSDPGNRCLVQTAAAARARRHCDIHLDAEESTAVFGRIAAGGFFNGPTRFDQERGSTGDDAFVVLLNPGDDVNPGGEVVSFFSIGGPGNQRITALAIDERTQDIFVAGWYDHPETNFNPDPSGTPVHPSGYQDGRDLFVARYNVRFEGVQLLWLYTFGTTATPGEDFYDDEATCLALGVNDDPTEDPLPCTTSRPPSTLAIVGGIRSDTPRTTPGAGRNDLLFLAVSEPSSGFHATTKWLYSPAGDHDERVSAVAVDGIGRPVFTGHVGCYVASGAPPCTGQTLVDFDPGPGTLTLPSDSQNAFVVRYHPITGGLDWAYAIGGNLNEAGTAIAFDPAYTGRFALTGWFGRPDAAPGQYTIDLDPGPGTTPVTSAGFADAFLSVLKPAVTQDVGFQVSLVLSNSCSMTVNSVGEESRDFVDMLDGLRINLVNPAVIPLVGSANPGGGTRRQAVQVNAVFYTTTPLDGLRARQVMPWTVFDAQTAPLFARRLAALPPLSTGSQGVHDQRMSDGMLVAAASLARSGVGPEAYSSMLVIGDASGDAAVPAARDASWGPALFDRICAFGGWGQLQPGYVPPPDVREYLLMNVIAPFDPSWTTPQEVDRSSTGIATGSHTLLRTWPPPPQQCDDYKWHYVVIVQRLLQRLCWCPSDYTRDECTSIVSTPPSDPQAFENGYRVHPLSPYADWNMDLQFEEWSTEIDRPKFELRLPGAGSVCLTCPSN
jgi:hypothetical protein